MAGELLSSMLSKISDSYDKSAGSFIYDVVFPAASILEDLQSLLDEARAKQSIENLSGDELTQRVLEMSGIARKEATWATGRVLLQGTGTINAGDLFETANQVQFRATESKEINVTGYVMVEATVPGAIGMVTAETINLFPVTLTGFTSVNNTEPTEGGFEAESDSSLISRYYLKIQEQPSSGNPAHYIQLAKEIPGIAEARVYRAWDGPGTVKVVLLSEDRRTPGASVVAQASQLINDNRPINADVTVVGVAEVLINISAILTLKTGGVLENAIEQIRTSVGDYLKSLAFADLIIRYNKIGEAMLDAEDVLDWSNLRVNGGTGNIELLQDQVPVMGVVNMII